MQAVEKIIFEDLRKDLVDRYKKYYLKFLSMTGNDAEKIASADEALNRKTCIELIALKMCNRLIYDNSDLDCSMNHFYWVMGIKNTKGDTIE